MMYIGIYIYYYTTLVLPTYYAGLRGVDYVGLGIRIFA